MFKIVSDEVAFSFHLEISWARMNCDHELLKWTGRTRFDLQGWNSPLVRSVSVWKWQPNNMSKIKPSITCKISSLINLKDLPTLESVSIKREESFYGVWSVCEDTLKIRGGQKKISGPQLCASSCLLYWGCFYKFLVFIGRDYPLIGLVMKRMRSFWWLH